jgi:ankyrin repeat protein
MKEPKHNETRVDPRLEKEEQLFDAIEASDEQVVRDLVASGVDVNVRSLGGGTPLGRAIHTSGQDSIVTFLIESGARTVDDYNLKDETLNALESRNLPQAALLLLKLTIQVGSSSGSERMHLLIRLAGYSQN